MPYINPDVPIIRITIVCGRCGAHNTIVVGNPDTETKKEDSPLMIVSNDVGMNIHFTCRSCGSEYKLPRKTQPAPLKIDR